MTYGEAVNEAMRIAMREDPTVILMGEDIAGGADVDHLINEDAWGGPMGVTKGLVQEFGRNRVLDTPITEAGFIGAAVGAAATGLRPVAELMFVDFFGCCMDQIFDQGAKLRYMFGGKAKCPLVIRTMIGAGVNAAGQHSGCHYSVFTHMPGIKTRRALDTGRRQGSAAHRDPRRRSGDGLREQGALRDEGRGAGGQRGHPARQGRHQARRRRRHDRRHLAHGPAVARRRRRRWPTTASRPRSSTRAPSRRSTRTRSSPRSQKTHRLVDRRRGQPALQRRRPTSPRWSPTRDSTLLDAPIKIVTAPHTPVPFSPPLEQFYIPSPERIADAVRAIM